MMGFGVVRVTSVGIVRVLRAGNRILRVMRMFMVLVRRGFASMRVAAEQRF